MLDWTRTQCGRVVDEISCYCATFDNVNISNFNKESIKLSSFNYHIYREIIPIRPCFCLDNKMKLDTFENQKEEFVQKHGAPVKHVVILFLMKMCFLFFKIMLCSISYSTQSDFIKLKFSKFLFFIILQKFLIGHR